MTVQIVSSVLRVLAVGGTGRIQRERLVVQVLLGAWNEGEPVGALADVLVLVALPPTMRLGALVLVILWGGSERSRILRRALTVALTHIGVVLKIEPIIESVSLELIKTSLEYRVGLRIEEVKHRTKVSVVTHLADKLVLFLVFIDG